MSTLYTVATPIGNLGDMTFRGVEILKSVDFVLAEDTRQTKKLLNHYEISVGLKSFHAQSSPAKTAEILALLASGKTAALVSDAGTPCISDPGFRLVASAWEQGTRVVPIPGACALTALVSASGLRSERFAFWGFLPHKKGRQTLIKSLADQEQTVIFYESVHRFPRLLDEFEEHLGSGRVIGIGRELTKLHEEIFRGTVGEAQLHFTTTNTKGEFVVMVTPNEK